MTTNLESQRSRKGWKEDNCPRWELNPGLRLFATRLCYRKPEVCPLAYGGMTILSFPFYLNTFTFCCIKDNIKKEKVG